MKSTLFSCLFLLSFSLLGQNLPDSCKLNFGTNLGGLADYATELPFVDLMHNCREWYTKDVENPNGSPFDSEQATKLAYRPDGYPTHIPQTIAGVTYAQRVVTIWASTNGWTAGKYTVLYDGNGELDFWGGYSNLTQATPNRITFDFNTPADNILEMVIVRSDINNPVRNIRVLMPGSEATYQTQPFNPIWLNKVKMFGSVRFMDWGQTNNWGQTDQWSWEDTTKFTWAERQQLGHYTWANNKGIPYEVMIRFLNETNVDGWVCVPHRASNEYIKGMAQLFFDGVEPGRHLTVEYSNEIWNWMFGQTNWLFKYGCTDAGVPWPEGVVPYIQNCLNIWTQVYAGHLDRITRTVGVQTAWQDVSNRMVFNMTPNSFDAFSPTFYFGLGDEADAALDALGTSATAADVAYWARKTREDNEKPWMISQKTTIADSLNIPMLFYEGGQHLTPTPFGEEPSYAQALEDIQRDTAMYNLYDEWFDFVRTLQSGSATLQLMNFSFISPRSARYGSWGILETMDQDISAIPAPKFEAIRDNMSDCSRSSNTAVPAPNAAYRVVPNPTSDVFSLQTNLNWERAVLYNALGQPIRTFIYTEKMSLAGLPIGVYVLEVFTAKNAVPTVLKIVKD